MPTRIRNTGASALTLPLPLYGTVEAGGGVVTAMTPAQIIAAFADELPVTVILEELSPQSPSPPLIDSGIDMQAWASLRNLPDPVNAGDAAPKRYVDVSGAPSTGLLDGGSVSINTASPPTFDISAGRGVIVDWTDPAAPVQNVITWNAFTGVAVANPGVLTSSVAIDENGALVQVPFRFTPSQQREYIELGILVTLGGALTATGDRATFLQNVAHDISDLVSALGDAVNDTGNVYSPVGGGLTIKKSAGTTFALAANHNIDPMAPNTPTDPAIDPIPGIIYVYRDGVGGWVTVPPAAAIDPANYDDGSGTLQTVTANQWTIQLIYWTAPSQATVVQYGQVTYGTLAAAEAAITAPIAINPESRGSALRCYLISRGGAADLALGGDASFAIANQPLPFAGR